MSACDKPRVVSAPTTLPVPLHVYLDHAQPKLRTLKLWLGAEEIEAELAMSRTEVATGMMFRKEIGEREGMLFVFAQPHRASFYMRNTYVPLSCAYLDGDGVIREIHKLEPLEEKPVEASTDSIQYVLEVAQGWFERHNIGVGTVVRTEKGSMAETFFRR